MSDSTKNSSSEMVFWGGVSLAILAMLILGWWFGQRGTAAAPAPADVAGVQCLPVPNGMAFNGTALVPLDASPDTRPATPASVPDVDMGLPAWATGIVAAFPGLGFPWMDLEVDGETATLSGMAPTVADKRAGYELGSSAILGATDANPRITRVVDDIDVSQRGDWVDPLKASFDGIGFDWMAVSVSGDVATLTGTAPDAAAKEAAFRLGSLALESNPAASRQINLIVDGISIEGGERAAGAALADLSEGAGADGPTLEACRAAFVDTMDGRNIEFEVNRTVINQDSARLLDAVSGVAILCTTRSGFDVEIGGHTDVRGSEASNQRLSQGRAQAVLTYLVDRGVPAEKLAAVGYGESRPLDRAMTDAAHALNRRTEFLVMDPAG